MALAVHDWDIRQPYETPPSLAPDMLFHSF